LFVDGWMKQKVLLVGWDAADWKIVNPLMERHLMPATRRLVEQGVIANMATLSPVLSPMLWTSIATGKRPYKHGILGFTEPAPAGGIQPITNLSRTTKAVWNILGQNGLRSTIVGWWPSHPAEPIYGVMVSNHYQRAGGPMGRGWPMRPGTVHPPHLVEALAEVRVHPQELEADHLLPFIPHGARIDQEMDRRLETCVKILAECSTIQSCATWLMEHEPWDFMAVYFDAIDHFCHAFMRYHPPQQDWITDEDFDLYQHVVTAGYVYHDMMLTRLVELAGPDTTVILMSDHGFHPDHLRRRTMPHEPAGPAVEHRDFGIFVMSGPGIRQDELIHGVNLLDVTPTVLTLFGLAVGDDMDGRPLVEAFEKRPSVPTIPSWDEVLGDDGRHPPGSHLSAADAHEGVEHLVALGYINRPSGDAAHAVRETQLELDYNLARSYMDAGRHGDAVPLLTALYMENPLEFRFGIQLAMCLQALGVVADLARLIDDLNGRWRLASEEARRRLQGIAEIAKERRAARSHATDPGVRSERPIFSEAESRVVRSLRAVARGNPGTLDYLAGCVATARKEFGRALEHFKRADRSQSLMPGFHIQLGEAYLRLERLTEAEACFRRALELEPANAAASLGLAKMFLRRRKPQEALDAATRSVSLRYHLPAGHYVVALARLALHDAEGAVAALEVALSQNPNFAEAHARLARIFTRDLCDDARGAGHRAMARQIRFARSRQARAPIIPPLPPLDSIRYDEHLPEFPTDRRPAGRLPSLAESAAIAGDAASGSASADAVVVVSGLPRSGTSLMMQMLLAGGIAPMTDGDRVADASNPRGYFELAKVRALPERNDWVGEARGRAIKVVAPMVPFLPQQVPCRVIVMDRNLEEIVSSQRQMLRRTGLNTGKLGDPQLKMFLTQQLNIARSVLKIHGVPTLVVPHDEVLRDPDAVARRVAEFVGRPLDVHAMAAAVDPRLLRERAATVAAVEG
jgi:tetratricopeptide (TPR) repeat protein